MRTFKTSVCLSLKQAQTLVNAIYPEHKGAQLQSMPKKRDNIANKLIELFILPVGRYVAYSRDNSAHVFDYDNMEGREEITLVVPYNETQTARILAIMFLTCESFGELKFELQRQLKYKWEVKQKEA